MVHKKPVLNIIVLLLFSVGVMAQKSANSYQYLDVAVASGGGGFSPALGYEKIFALGKNGKFKLGYGLRYTGFFSQNKNLHFRTAPAMLTSGKKSIVALFSEDIVGQIDTLHISNVQTNAINLNIKLGYALFKKIEIGFNIDAIGFTFGKKQEGVFKAVLSDDQGISNNSKKVLASPTKLNLLLISDSDMGSLNSELFAKLTLTEKIGVRAGASFQFLEYTADKKLAFDNNRFRTKQLLPFVALSFKI
jgi:hypothetical protein